MSSRSRARLAARISNRLFYATRFPVMSTNTTQQPSKPHKSGAHRTNALPSGYVLDEYRIDAILGAGGFGVTYKALDTHLDAWVAIKEYFPVEWSFRDADGVTVHANTQGLSSINGAQTSDYEWGLERFLDEARVLARIQHPYVVRVKRYFRANGTAYIVMEYEEGEPLSTILDETGTLHEEEVRGLLEDVLPALQAVHEQGYLHRDIKPANLYVRARDHRVMLIDFGAARAAISRHSQNVTSLVTPGYSPPEQYTTRNDRYGTWTDLYALGAVLYRCVTGHTPAEAADRLLDDHLEPAVMVGHGRYSTNLLHAIDRVLAVRPEMRFRDVTEMQAALAGSRDEESDETVIMAPAPKTGKAVQETPVRTVTRQQPPELTVKGETDAEWPETVQPAVAPSHPEIESPQPPAGRREVLATPPAPVNPPSRRVPVAILAGAAGVVGAVALGAWLWWGPTAPPPAPDLDQRGPPSSIAHPAPPTTEPSATTAPPPPPAAETSPAAPAASPTGGALPAAVETTAHEPAPTTRPETPLPAGESPAPVEPVHQARQPIQFQEEPATAQPAPFQEEPATAQPAPFQEEPTTAQPAPFQEEPATPKAPASTVTTGTAAPPSPTPPALAPSSRVRPQSGAAQPTTTQVTPKPDTAKKAPARQAEPTRTKKTPRPKRERRPRSRTEPTIVTPAKPTRSTPALRTTNPWESPASTGFNSK